MKKSTTRILSPREQADELLEKNPEEKDALAAADYMLDCAKLAESGEQIKYWRNVKLEIKDIKKR